MMSSHSGILTSSMLAVVIACAPASATAQVTDDNPRHTPVVKVVQENSNAVVNISTERVVLLREYPSWGNYGDEFDLFFERFFSALRPAHAFKLKSVGSGVIVDKNGIIVTNAHVVNMASSIFAILHDGTSIEGKVVYEDDDNDLALVKIEPAGTLSQVNMAAPGDIIIGESVVAIGNPLGLENSVTLGIISGNNRSLYTSSGEVMFNDLIQTDAPINPGNSGGALLNLAGELVGINVAVVQNSQSIGFAIPVRKVRKLLDAYSANRGLTIQNKNHRPSKRQLQPKSRLPVQPQAPLGENEWDPFSEFSRARRQMDRMIREMLKENPHQGMGVFSNDFSYTQDINIDEQDDAYVIRLNVAGLDKSKISIEVNEGSITISGERSQEAKENSPGKISHAHSYRLFSRTTPLPDDVAVEGIKTRTEGDTLLIILPKRQKGQGS